ncbi:hypothetical protein ACSVDE_09655 [Pseudalkalibacillus sp. Hm43]|uniref:hypothetical protein n=1 Tax=Pseudalkalibacillus sp. Hm43 TaxID=3450742 RepID=UPI003F41D13F
MENVMGFVLISVQVLIILYVIFSLAVMNHKLNTLLQHFNLDEESQGRVSNEEIEKELEEQVDNK